MPTQQHVLVAPVAEGGELVFAHALDSGIRVWMRGLVRRVDEYPRRHKLRGVAAPLYGGSISDMEPLRDFLTDFVDNATDDPSMRLSPGRIRDVPPLRRRCDVDSPSNYPFFAQHMVSPLQTYGPWEAAAAEVVFYRTRGAEQQSMGYFATGFPVLPADVEPAAVFDLPSAAVIGREQAEELATFLQTPPGPVLEDLLPKPSRRAT